jgi:hypothetical protein
MENKNTFNSLVQPAPAQNPQAVTVVIGQEVNQGDGTSAQVNPDQPYF